MGREREREREETTIMQGTATSRGNVMQARSAFKGARLPGQGAARGGRVTARASNRTQAHVTNAKYGDDGKYFDLNDIENTSGSWDMYGMEEGVKYPVSQEEFFKRASFGLARREALLGFIALGGGGSTLVWGLKGSSDAQLPITKGPAPKAPPPPPKAEEPKSEE